MPQIPPKPQLPQLPDPPDASAPFRFIRKLLKGTRQGLRDVVDEVKGLGSDMRR